MRILFVDDDVAVLDGIRRVLYGEDLDWEIDYAVGGPAALELLGTDSFDVVVTDMCMPDVDGVAILEFLQRRHPQTIRLVLSGQAQIATAMSTIPLAHQFVAKPCRLHGLITSVQQAISIQRQLHDTALLPVVGGINALPSPPGVIVALNRELSAPEIKLDRVAALVATDPAISSKTLQVVNSAFFGLARHIDDIGSAVRYLGAVTVQNLAVNVHAFQLLETHPTLGQVVEQLQHHSTHVAELSRALVGGRSLSGQQAYSCGLLHDIGILVLAAREPDRLAETLHEARAGKRPLVDIEHDAYGASHAEIGAYFLSLWGLPACVVESVLYHHHDREPVPPFSPMDASHLAERLVAARPSLDRWNEGVLTPVPPGFAGAGGIDHILDHDHDHDHDEPPPPDDEHPTL